MGPEEKVTSLEDFLAQDLEDDFTNVEDIEDFIETELNSEEDEYDETLKEFGY